MSTLWVFGDSFAEDKKEGRLEILDQQWHRQLAKRLRFDIVNHGINGTGLEWLYYTWQTERNKITKDDLVVVMITEQQRRWLIKDQPRYSNPWAFFKFKQNWEINSQQATAIEMYYKHLDNDLYFPALLENWMYNVKDLQKNIGCKILLISSFRSSARLLDDLRMRFPELDFAHGHMFEISKNEYIKHLRDTSLVHDGRPNHIVPINHSILTDKIFSWYENKTPVDLTTGFHESVIDGSNFDDPLLFAHQHRIDLN